MGRRLERRECREEGEEYRRKAVGREGVGRERGEGSLGRFRGDKRSNDCFKLEN